MEEYSDKDQKVKDRGRLNPPKEVVMGLKSMIHIGADVQETNKILSDILSDITTCLLKIITAPVGDEVKIKAIETLKATFEVHNVSVTNCTLTNKGYERKCE